MKTGRINRIILTLGIVVATVLALSIFLLEPDSNKISVEQGVVADSPVSNSIPDFDALTDITKKKQAFFKFLTPLITRYNAIIIADRNFLLQSQWQLNQGQQISKADAALIFKIARKYQYSLRVVTNKTLSKLLRRVDTIPQDLVLIQAASETAWGSRTFAKQGHNFFSQWCVDKECGLVVKQSGTEGNYRFAVFKSVDDSVDRYMHDLNSDAAYSLLRQIRADLRAQGKPVRAEDLVYGLTNYSPRQGDYVKMLLEMLRQNKQYLVSENDE